MALRRTERASAGGGEADQERLQSRLSRLEDEVDSLRREVATLKVELASETRRANATVDWYEQRVDRIYGRISAELAQVFGDGTVAVETDDAVDERVAQLFAAGLERPVPLADMSLSAALSDRISMGELPRPFTLTGFRIDRRRGQEFGTSVELFAVSEGSTGGAAFYGPYKRLAPGKYRLEAVLQRLRPATGSPTGDVALDVYSPGTDAVLGANGLPASKLKAESTLAVEFEWSADHARSGAEFRIHQNSNLALAVTRLAITDIREERR